LKKNFPEPGNLLRADFSKKQKLTFPFQLFSLFIENLPGIEMPWHHLDISGAEPYTTF